MDLVGWLSWATNVQASSTYFWTQTNLQKHVSWFNSAICCHSPSFHNRANVYATITPVIALSYNADSQEVILFYTGRKWRVGGEKSKQGDWNDSEELTPGYFSREKSVLSTHQLGHIWLTIISGYPIGVCLPGTFRERQQGNAAKDIIFSYRTLKSYTQKISKRNDIEKTCLYLEMRHPISIR